MHADTHVSARITSRHQLYHRHATYLSSYLLSAFGSSSLGSFRENGRGSMFYLAMSRRPLVCSHILDSYELACQCLLVLAHYGCRCWPSWHMLLGATTALTRSSGRRLQSVVVQSGSDIRLLPVKSSSILPDQLRGRSVTLFQGRAEKRPIVHDPPPVALASTSRQGRLAGKLVELYGR